MAAPASKTNKDLNGKWSMNKELSNSTEAALALQGISYLVRKGISMASITLEVNQYEAPPKPPNTSTDVFTHIDIDQTAAGFAGTKEARCLDGEFRDHSDWLFGAVRGETHWVAADEIADKFLEAGWEPVEGKGLVRSYVESQGAGWTATQIWGFQVIDGVRRYSRNIVVAKGDKRVEMRLVYDFVS